MTKQAPPPTQPTQPAPAEVDHDLQSLLTIANAMLDQLSPANHKVFMALLQQPVDALNAKLTQAKPETPAK